MSALDARPYRLFSGWTAIALLLTLAAFAIRAVHFGNPVIHVDESFYLLVGDRMWHGALPFVDIWDRKPVGLFLIYAAIRLLGGVGIVQYQIVATLFAAGTAFLVARIAAMVAPRASATVAGLLYLLGLEQFGGEGGQAPVFYNLLVAGAALVTMRAWAGGGRDAAAIRRRGCLAMVLLGLALQIKYSVLFEGVGFGLALLWLAWRADPRPLPRVADAALWIALALAPTMAAWAWYAGIGHGADFVYANFTSIFLRAPEPGWVLVKRVLKLMLALLPLIACILLSERFLSRWRRPWTERPGGSDAHRFLLLWLLAAALGFLAFGSYFRHYVLPLLAPLTALCAPAFAHDRHRAGTIAAIVMLLFGSVVAAVTTAKNVRRRGDAVFAARVVALVRPHLAGCMYVFDGEAILYHLTGSCLPSRWAFPNHINLTREAPALGVDPLVEARRIMAGRPSVVVDTIGRSKDLNRAAQAIVHGELRRHYRLVGSVPLASGKEWRLVYARLPG